MEHRKLRTIPVGGWTGFADIDKKNLEFDRRYDLIPLKERRPSFYSLLREAEGIRD